MNTLIPIEHYIYLSTALFSIGVIGVLMRRNAIIIFMSIELMLNAANLLLAAFPLIGQILQVRSLCFSQWLWQPRKLL